MKLTENDCACLEKLIHCLLLDHKHQIVVLKGWKTEKIERKPWFGKSYTETILKALYFKSNNSVGTKYYNVVSPPELSFCMNLIEGWRQNFVNMKADLDKFGFVIKSKQHCRR